MSEIKKDGWIPIEESVPETGKYIMVSFENFTLPDIARYETDEQGNGAFYPGDEDKPYIEYGLVVNAWMPLQKPYREEEEAAVDETTKKPTREQKELIALNNLRPDNWMVISDNSAEMQIISKRSAQRRTIEKKRR